MAKQFEVQVERTLVVKNWEIHPGIPEAHDSPAESPSVESFTAFWKDGDELNDTEWDAFVDPMIHEIEKKILEQWQAEHES